MKLITFIPLIAFLASCSSVPLTPQEQGVKILRKSDAPSQCKELSRVHAPGLASLSDEGREADLKRATFKAGGDTVTIINRDENNTIYGIAYKCN
ncbi:hypothetical protein DOM21_17405 [Bacteriovorax stolpii]|uniref:hypothetical protein n=1 Tax=Bacteriovorax stolpii TaxID=960 RepID=UPI00115B6110|nr:hypothetical protein [Bacteriovorax stolpii]QDK43200.1 hypothetical protein DOM21_17405 [Bacteriovorax stolpii]